MRNPWTTKNPFMSVWLSGAHRVAGAASAQARAATRREVAAAQAEMGRQMIDFWAASLTGGVKKRR